MKKMLALAAILAFTGHAMAAEGGFKSGETPPPVHKKDAGYKGSEDTGESTIHSLFSQRDNAWVTVEGYLIKQTDDKSYMLRDDSGKINIKVPTPAWDGKEYNSKDMVRVSGYVKGKGDARYLQVQRVEKP
ncbi:NirD/YgiW/YdeI family stress tolerance protein [Erwinia pyri]|uniref:NirD/YgiW/YdeI family stress tolerance protein n=1 Tax=Erwinia pyri TaxID=3062598 RepID=A0AA50HN05_9GAMM|nr:NirD/YgiW/YdeI family stress tolerance protein [Erwinia sp. DE2]WLS80793.1 NirD/YgiW/YdeI family stress tolerance protein [Erwinia sp. DE2]